VAFHRNRLWPANRVTPQLQHQQRQCQPRSIRAQSSCVACMHSRRSPLLDSMQHAESRRHKAQQQRENWQAWKHGDDDEDLPRYNLRLSKSSDTLERTEFSRGWAVKMTDEAGVTTPTMEGRPINQSNQRATQRASTSRCVRTATQRDGNTAGPHFGITSLPPRFGHLYHMCCLMKGSTIAT
jgi:hypothetical protein